MVDILDPDDYFDLVLYAGAPGGRRLAPGPAQLWRTWWDEIDRAEPIVTFAARQGFVLHTRRLTSFGVSRSAARTAVRREVWTAAGHGYVAPIDARRDLPDYGAEHVLARRRHALMCASGALRRSAHVVSGRSAAVLHGLPTFNTPGAPELTAYPTVGLGPRSSAHVHGASLSESSTAAWFGIPVTSVARTLVDLTRHDRRDGIMAADAALRERLVTSAEIGAEFAGASGWPGIRQARGVLGLASPLAESPLESITRLAMHDDGFPAPEPQYEIGPYQVDFCWPARRFIVEADGMGKYTDEESRREKRREQWLRNRGWRIERVLWDEVVRQWQQTSRRLWSAFLLPT